MSLLRSEPLLERVPDGMSDAQFAAYVGVQEKTVVAWRRGTPLKPHTADRVAVRLGLHMDNIWTIWERS